MSVCVCASVCGKVFEELQMGNKWGRVVSGSVWRMGVFDLEANNVTPGAKTHQPSGGVIKIIQ